MDIKTSLRWIEFETKNFTFGDGKISQIIRSSDKTYSIVSRATVLALGGASWAKLGSDGKWQSILKKYFKNKKLSLIPSRAADMGLKIKWSDQMKKFEGQPVKPIAIKVNDKWIKGEFVITRIGVEGGIIYWLSTMTFQYLTGLE